MDQKTLRKYVNPLQTDFLELMQLESKFQGSF